MFTPKESLIVKLSSERISRRKYRARAWSALVALCLGILTPFSPVSAQTQAAATYPNKPVKLVVAFPPGGATDLIGRLLASKLSEVWGQSVLVENKADSIPRFAFSGTLGPGERRLVFGKESYDWERAGGHPAFGLSLGNSGDDVILWQISGAESLVVDRYHYRSHEAAADRAVGRAPDGSGGWALFDALNPYTGTLVPGATGCSPSPAAINLCDTTPAKRVSWGRVKLQYH